MKVVYQSSGYVAFLYLMDQWIKRLNRAKLWSIFVYILLPVTVVFAISLPRFGLLFTAVSLGLGPVKLPIPLLVPSEVQYDDTKPPQSKWRSERKLVWVDNTGTGIIMNTSLSPLRINITNLIHSLPGYTLTNTQQLTTEEEMVEYCKQKEIIPGKDSCFAGIVFHGLNTSTTVINGSSSSSSVVSSLLPLNYTLYYPNTIDYLSIDVRTLGQFGKAGFLTLQRNIELAAAAQLLPALSSSILSSTTLVLPYTSIGQVDYNTQYTSYFSSFMSDTASAAMTLIQLPQIFWLAHTIATDTETRTRDAITIMGLRRWIYYLTLYVQYFILILPMCLLTAVLVTFLTFTSSDFLTNFLLVTLPSIALLPSSILFAFMFSKARLAGPAVAFTWFIVGGCCSQLRVIDESMSSLKIIAAVIFPPAGLNIGVSLLAYAEEAAITMVPSQWGTVIPGQGISIGNVFGATCGSIGLYSLLHYMVCVKGWVFAMNTNLLKRYGNNFLRTNSIARPIENSPSQHMQDTHPMDDSNDVIRETNNIEAEESAFVRLKNVTKVYPDMKKAAVTNLSLECYDSEVLVLLGKNGCGKTTTVHMIAGLLQPSQGSIQIKNENSSQNTIGWCPQHDILWLDVNVRDTLAVYAAIKGVPASAISDEAEKWAKQAGLSEKLDAFAGTLSGGQKRRLSLAAALIGNSSILLLDEPSAGVDPINRRLLWDLINNNKNGRTILLTTHFLDEAEALGDRIAVMDAGKLRALGTSIYLKQALSLGYYLTVTQDSSISSIVNNNSAANNSIEELLTFVQSYIPKACLLSSEKYSSIFSLPMEIPTMHSSTNLPAVDRERNGLTSLLTALEDPQTSKTLSISTLGLSSASLHDVFMKLVGSGEDKVKSVAEVAENIVPEFPWIHTNDRNEPMNRTIQTMENAKNFPTGSLENSEDLSSSSVVKDVSGFRAFCTRIYAVLRKRALLSWKDLRSTLFPLVIVGCASIAIAIIFKTEEPITCPLSFSVAFPPVSITDAVSQGIPYGPSKTVVITDQSPTPIVPTAYLTYTNDTSTLRSTLEIQSYRRQLWGGWDVSFFPTWPNIGTITYDISLPQADMRILNAYHNALYAKASGIPSSVMSTMQLQPFPVMLSSFSSRDWKAYLGLIGSVAIACAVAMPLMSTLLISRERNSGLKMQQMMSGLHSVEYWFSNLLWDCIPAFLIALFISISLTSLPIWLPSFGTTLLLFFLYGLAAAAWGYALSFAVSTPAGTVALHSCLSFAITIGYVTGLITAAPDPIQDKTIVDILAIAAIATHPLSALVEATVLPGANIFFSLCWDGSAATYISSKGAEGSTLSINIFKWCAIALGIHTCVAMIIVLVLDNRRNTVNKQQLCSRNGCFRKGLFDKSKADASINPINPDGKLPVPGSVLVNHPVNDTERDTKIIQDIEKGIYMDEDVITERNRVMAAYGSGQAISDGNENDINNDNVVVLDVRKRFWVRKSEPPIAAVKGVTLGLSDKECYAHIGQNGAGKTTLLRILSGQELPDSGRVIVCGHELSSDLAGLRRNIGVCPQFDILYGELSAVEHIRYYAALRGIPPGPTTEKEIVRLITTLDLVPHAHKPSSSLSGGNKRKLSVALALVGRPSVIILDEPTTGMDPASKRFMWAAISSLRKHHTIILTTHSMEECEAVAQRVGIMTEGHMAALGSLQRLKARFGQEYQLDAICATPQDAIRMEEELKDALPGMKLVEHHGQQVRFIVPLSSSSSLNVSASTEGNTTVKTVSLSYVLEVLEARKNDLHIRAYQVSQMTLEQIFLRLTNPS